MDKNAVTLDEMLTSREERALYQSSLINEYNCPLVSFTVVMPGAVKLNKMSEKIFLIGKEKIESALKGYNVKFKGEKNKKTGPEAYYCVDLSASVLKRLMTEVEDQCKIGRLFDIDVIGNDYKPVSRTELGMPDRKCLICGGPSHACARSRKHSVDELLTEIERVLSNE